jgi:hypothetical protein
MADGDAGPIERYGVRVIISALLVSSLPAALAADGAVIDNAWHTRERSRGLAGRCPSAEKLYG